MKDNNNLIKDIKGHLDQSLETIDPKILSRIREARYNALEQKRPGLMRWVLPVGGVAVAAIVLLLAINLFTGQENITTTQIAEVVKTAIDKPEPEKVEIPLGKNTEPEIQPGQIELVEILSSDQHMDLFENLEFYSWFAENENMSG
jgi:hypothetical protein